MGTETRSWQVDVEHPDTNATFVVVAGSEAKARKLGAEMAAAEIGAGATVLAVRPDPMGEQSETIEHYFVAEGDDGWLLVDMWDDGEWTATVQAPMANACWADYVNELRCLHPGAHVERVRGAFATDIRCRALKGEWVTA